MRLAMGSPRYLGIPPQMLPRVDAVFPALQAGKETLPWQQAFAAHQAGDRLTAFAQMNALAKSGDADACYLLALMYMDGEIICKDGTEGMLYRAKGMGHMPAHWCEMQMFYWLDIASNSEFGTWKGKFARKDLPELAHAGYVPAQNFLGCLYHQDKDSASGLAPNPAKAREWFAKAAAQNDATGQYNLALAFETGNGGPCDLSQARAFYEKAAAQGFAPAQWRLGWLYAQGRSVAHDAAQARAWFEKAAAQGDADAQNALGLQALLHDEDVTQAFVWFTQAAAQGLAAAQNNLAVLSEGTAQRDGLLQAAGQGEPLAWFNLGVLDTRGDDWAQARLHYAQAALRGVSVAQERYLPLVDADANIPSEAMRQALADWRAGDCRQARAAVQQAAAAGEVWAQFCLACIYDDNNVFLRDAAQAVQWFTRAAAGGNSRAQFHLGRYYHDAVRNMPDSYRDRAGVIQAYDQARLWLVQAALQGDRAAQRALAIMLEKRDYGAPDAALAAYWRELAEQSPAPPADPPGSVWYDIQQAVAWFAQRGLTAGKPYAEAARQGNAVAQYWLGVAVQYGDGVPQSFARAFQWYERAAKQDCAPAQVALGFLLEYGKGVAANAAQARQWYELAAQQGYTAAQYRLGLLYRDGAGVPQDMAKARAYLTLAAVQDDAAAQRALAGL